MQITIFAIGFTILFIYIKWYKWFGKQKSTTKSPASPTLKPYTLEDVIPYPPRTKKLDKKQWNAAIRNNDHIIYDDYINSPLWKDSLQRLNTLKADNYSCRMCSSPERLEVHHISYENIPNEQPKDLATLCHLCHKKTHDIAGKGAKYYPPQHR